MITNELGEVDPAFQLRQFALHFLKLNVNWKFFSTKSNLPVRKKKFSFLLLHLVSERSFRIRVRSFSRRNCEQNTFPELLEIDPFFRKITRVQLHEYKALAINDPSYITQKKILYEYDEVFFSSSPLVLR